MLTLNVGGRQIACKIGLSSMWNIYIYLCQPVWVEWVDRQINPPNCNGMIFFLQIPLWRVFTCCCIQEQAENCPFSVSMQALTTAFCFLGSLYSTACSVQEGSFLAEELAVPMLCPGTLRNALLQSGTALSWHKSLRLTSIQSIVPLRILKVMFEMLICPDSLNDNKVMTVVRMRFPDPYVVKTSYLLCWRCALSPRTQTGTSMTTGWWRRWNGARWTRWRPCSARRASSPLSWTWRDDPRE